VKIGLLHRVSKHQAMVIVLYLTNVANINFWYKAAPFHLHLLTPCSFQGDHSPDSVKFLDGLRPSSVALDMLSVTKYNIYTIMSVLVLHTFTDANMQFTINSFRQLFHKFFPPDISLLFSKTPKIYQIPCNFLQGISRR